MTSAFIQSNLTPWLGLVDERHHGQHESDASSIVDRGQSLVSHGKSRSIRMKFHFKGRIPCLISRNALLLTGILVLGAVLRFNNITQPLIDNFNWRQASTAMMASNFYHKSWNIFYPEVSWTGSSPGYQGREFQTVSYIAALLYLVAGEHDWIGRSVAVLFGLWGIFALYQLVRRVWDEERALLSAAVMAVLPGSIFIERSFLPDPAMVALVTTSVWMLVAYLQTDRLRFLLLAGVIGAWGVLTKLPGLVVGFAMLYATLTILRRRHWLNRRKIAVMSIVVALALVPVTLYYLWAVHLGRSYPPYHIAGEGNWSELLLRPSYLGVQQLAVDSTRYRSRRAGNNLPILWFFQMGTQPKCCV